MSDGSLVNGEKLQMEDMPDGKAGPVKAEVCCINNV